MILYVIEVLHPDGEWKPVGHHYRDKAISEICDAVSVTDGRPTIAEMWALTMAELRELHDTLVDDTKGTVPA